MLTTSTLPSRSKKKKLTLYVVSPEPGSVLAWLESHKSGKPWRTYCAWLSTVFGNTGTATKTRHRSPHRKPSKTI